MHRNLSTIRLRRPHWLFGNFYLMIVSTLFLSPDVDARAKQSAQTAPIELSQLVIAIGETKIFRSTSPTIWVEDAKVLKVKAVHGRAQITGIAAGSSDLRIGAKAYSIQVVPVKSILHAGAIHGLTNKTVGLHAQMSDGELQVTGKLFQFKDWMDLAAIASEKKLTYYMRAEITSSVEAEARTFFNKSLTRAGLPSPNFVFGDVVELRLPNNHYKERFEKLLRPFGIKIHVDPHSLEVLPVVRVHVSIAEIRRDQTQLIGLKFPDSVKLSVNPIFGNAIDELVFTANALEARGIGRILASPNIICRSGKEAQFLAGGEFPIKIISKSMIGVEWKRYGIFMKFKPQADSTGRMNLSLDTEVSSIDASRSVDGIPALFKNNISTHFDLAKPQTVALSGLIKNEESQSIEGLPWLSRIPVLGALFSSQSFRENRTELVVFVRPEIVNEESASKRSSPLVKEINEATDI